MSKTVTLFEPSAASRLQKQADLGSDGQDGAFEVAMSNLAHAYLADKAPKLLDYEVGFQLIERSEDDQKATGIFGFKVGPNWLYAPVVYVNGDLKGHELLYIKSQDQFVPLKEAWVDDTLQKQPSRIGSGVGKNTRELGVHYPDMYRALQPPYKTASVERPLLRLSASEKQELAEKAAQITRRVPAAVATTLATFPDWVKIAVADLSLTLDKAEREGHPAPMLLDLVKTGGVATLDALHDLTSRFPKMRAGLAFYPESQVKEAFETAKTITAPKPPGFLDRPLPTFRKQAGLRSLLTPAKPNVSVMRYNPKATPLLATDAEKEALYRDGFLIKDAREESDISKAYAVDVKQQFEQVFTTPNQTGVYDVLMRDGETEKCLVVLSPNSARQSHTWCTVVRLDDRRKAWLNIHPSYVWVGSKVYDWTKWFESVGDADPDGSDSMFLGIGKIRSGTAPFRLSRSLGNDPRGGRVFKAYFDTYASKSRAPGYPKTDYVYCDDCSYADGDRIHLNQHSGSKLRIDKGNLYVPSDFKFLKLESEPEVDDDSDADDTAAGTSKPSNDIQLGDALDVQRFINTKTASLRIYHDGCEARINNRRCNPTEALIHLVVDHGFRESAARDMLKQAAKTTSIYRSALQLRVKYAEPYLTGGGPFAPAPQDPMMQSDTVMGSGHPAMYDHEQYLRVSDMKADPANRHAYDPTSPMQNEKAIGMAQQAAQTGQKELFDTSAVGSLLNAKTDDQLVDRYIGGLMKGMHYWGCILLSFYWRGEKFAERYGQSDMPELEDGLRNAFLSSGDTIIFLKRKTIEASPADAEGDIDLGDVSSQ